MTVIARRSFLIGTALAPFAPSFAAAQSWPSHAVTLIIPFPAGGAMDVLARSVAQDLGEKLGQQFVADNRVGAAMRAFSKSGNRFCVPNALHFLKWRAFRAANRYPLSLKAR